MHNHDPEPYPVMTTNPELAVRAEAPGRNAAHGCNAREQRGGMMAFVH
jgi:hypothetical protein